MPSSTPTAASSRRRRLPRHVYWRRRLIVLLALGVVGWAGLTAVSGLFGSDGGTASPAESDELAIVAPDTVAGPGASTDPVADTGGATAGGADAAGVESDPAIDTIPDEVVATTEVTTTVAEEPADDDLPPSVENPASVHIVGDSDAGTFGPYLQTLLDNTLIVDTTLDYKVSSGLARPDFFNWPEQLRTTVPEVDPDIVVVTFGGNDSQGLSKPQDDLEFLVGDPLANEAEWSEEYQRRVLEVVDILLADGRDVVWVGSPNDNNPDVTAKLAIQDQAVRDALAQRPEVVFVDTWARFSGRDGNWAEFVVDPRDGVGKDVRADDGYHLNVTGAEILAIDIAVEVRDLLRAAGANI